MTHQKRFTLGKHERIKSRKAIQHLFQNGKSFTVFPLRILWAETSDTSSVRAAFAVSKKYFKKAPDRNRIKRLMREAYRLKKPAIDFKIEEGKGLDMFFIYTGSELPKYELIFEKIGKALDTMQQIFLNQ